MSLFPSVTPGLKVAVIPRWNTIITDMISGKENRTQTWVFPKRKILLNFPRITLDDTKSILNFFNNTTKGARYTFRWQHPISEAWTKEYVGRGDASTTTFTIPCIEGSSGTTTAYVDDVETSKTFSAGTGTDGLDQIIFSPAPANGSVITVSFTGYWTPQVRFEDEINAEYVLYDLLTLESLTLIEVRT